VDEFPIQVTDQPNETDWQWLDDTINRFNRELTGYDDYRPLAIFLRDTAGAIIAGLTAFTWGGTLRILIPISVLILQRHLKVVECFRGVKLMTTEEREVIRDENELDVIANGVQELVALHARIGSHFGRAEVRERVGRFLAGLLARVERKNGWQLAEELGESGPQGVQRLLNAADWDEEAVRDELRAYVMEHLEDEHGVLVVDETGFVKKGKKSVGVARQSSGTAGRRENSQIGVFLSYASRSGHAFIDRALYLPEEWTQDRVRCREAGVPESVSFATKGELAKRMLGRALAAGVKADWVVADSVYGYEEMRDWLERQHQKYVLAVPETHMVWSQGELQPVGLLGALLPT
jgi:hypothetical protein